MTEHTGDLGLGRSIDRKAEEGKCKGVGNVLNLDLGGSYGSIKSVKNY